MRMLLSLLALVLAAAPAFAASEDAGTGGGAFLKMGQGSARAMGLGRAFVALAEGTDALIWNPAGLGQTQQKEFQYSYLRYISEVDSPLYVAYAHPMGRTVIGVNAAYLTIDSGELDARDASGVPLSNSRVTVRDIYGAVSVARSFWYEKLFVGGSLRVIHENNAGVEHGSVVGDIGVLVKPNNILSLGFAAQHLGAQAANAAAVARGGAGLRLGEFFTIGLELAKAEDSDARFGGGVEFQLPEEYLEFGQLAFRLGYYNADSLGQSFDEGLQSLRLDKGNGLTFGFGLFTSRAFGYGLALDYAFVPFGALGSVDQLTFKLKF